MLKEVLRKSFKIVWQNPSFWIFGFFSTFFFLSANEFLLISLFPSLFFNLPAAKEISFLEKPTQLINPFLIVLLFLIFFFLLFLSIFSEVFLISSTVKKTRTDADGKIEKRSVWKVFLWRLLGILVLSLFWIILGNFINSLPYGFSFFLIFLFSLISLFLLFCLRYLVLYLVIKKDNFFLSFRNAFYFLIKIWFETLKLSFFLFIIISLYGFFTLVLFEGGALTYPLRIFNFVLSGVFGKYGFWSVALFTSFFVIILQVAISGLIASYQIVSWTLLFLKGSEKDVNNPIL